MIQKYSVVPFFILTFLLMASAQAKSPVSVIAYQVESRAVEQSVEVLGELRAIESIDITAKVSDVIERIHYQDGQRVKKGEPLVTFNQQQERALLKEKQIAAQQAKAQYQRLKNLQGRATVSQSRIDEQYRDWQVLEAQIGTIQTQLADRKITAPFAGQLGLTQVNAGQFVEVGTPLVKLVNSRKMQLDLMVSQRYLSQLELNQTVSLTTQAYPSESFNGQIFAISPQLDPITRMVRIRAHFDNPDFKLKNGMLVKAKLSFNSEKQRLIPNKSVLMLGDHQFVYRLIKGENRDYKVEKIKVSIGDIGEQYSQVLKGLQEGDTIVSQGVLNINPRKTVTIKAFENQQSQAALLQPSTND